MIALLALFACAYEAPVDPDREPMLNSVTGTIVYEGTEVPGPVHVLAYDVNNPPIPEGTGSPVTFASVDPADFTGEAGVLSAEYGISSLPDGAYYIRVLVDADWDFSPLATATTAASCGDEAGGYVESLDSTDLGVVTVQGGELAENITILVNRSYDHERAAFQIAEGSDQITQGAGLSTVTLEAIGIYSDLMELEGPVAEPGTPLSELADPCVTGFVLTVIDADGDGLADAHPNPLIAERGYFDIWPRVYLRFNGNDEYPLEEGEYYATEMPIVHFLMGIDPDAVVASGEQPVLDSIVSGWADLSLLYRADGSSEEVLPPNIPVSEWDITVAPYSGQVWTIPNETAEFPATDGAFDPSTQEQGMLILAAE